MRSHSSLLHVLLGSLALTAACGSKEAVTVQRAVEVNGQGVQDSTNELGWTVHVTKLRLAFRDVELTVEGEMHETTAAMMLRRASQLLIGTAHAHPGHYAGGAIDGELAGDFLVDFVADHGKVLGMATLITEVYDGGNLSFRKASAADGLAADDPLLGHTAQIAGIATRGATTITFTAVVDVDEGTRMVGAPFSLDLRDQRAATIGVEILTLDPFEKDTLFQKLDFAALDTDGDGALEIAPGSDGANLLRRTIQEHDHYAFTAK